MEVLLISPPTESAVSEVMGTTGPPLGLAYLASMVRDEHDVKIVDSTAEQLDKEDVAKKIKDWDPDIVGLTATTSAIPDAYEMAKIAKNNDENTRVVLGGPHATFLPERTMRECPHIDFVVREEGEYTFKELVSALGKGGEFRGIAGLTYRKGKKIISNPPRSLIENIDEIPIPSYDLLPMKKYRSDGIEFATILTSRGCPFRCVFCSSSLQFGKKWRGHSVERVMEELSMLRHEYGKTEIEFLDDTFTLLRPRAIAIADKMRKEGLDISWSASSRVDTFSTELANAVKKAGAHTVYFGLESGSQKTLDFIGKGITPEKSESAVKKARCAGLKTLGSFVIGFPDETQDDVNQTIKFSKKVGVDLAQFTIATPYPGTKLWTYALKRKLLLTMNWRKFTTLEPVMKLKYLTPFQIARALKLAYLKFYLRPKTLAMDLIRGKGFIFRKAMHYFATELFRRKRHDIK